MLLCYENTKFTENIIFFRKKHGEKFGGNT